jgi:nitroreductase
MEMREALRSTGAVREFEPTPVTRSDVYDLLDTARFAPSGGNRQSWRVIVVESPVRRQAVRDLYLPGWYEYLAQTRSGLVPFSPIADEAAVAQALERTEEIAAAAAAGPGGFAEHLDEVPVLLVVLADLRVVAAVDKDLDRYTFAGGASVYPFCWSILLAARDMGLGGVMTTMVARNEERLRTVLELESEQCVAAVLAIGRPVFQPTRLRRAPVESFTTVDSAGGPALTR